MVAAKLMYGVYIFTQLLEYLILAYVVMSWLVKPGSRLYGLFCRLSAFLEPLLYPFRRMLGSFTMRTGIDFSPFLAVLAISFVYRLIYFIVARTIV